MRRIRFASINGSSAPAEKLTHASYFGWPLVFQHLSSPTRSGITQRSAGHFPGVLDLYRVLTRRPIVHLHLPPAVTLHKRNDTLHRTPSVCLERFRRNTRFDQIRWQLCRAESIRNESCQSTEQPKSRRPTPLHYRILRRSARKLKAL